jgi:hypothetical protein
MAITKKSHRTGEIETTHVGTVLEVYNRDYRAMSDVYTYATFALVIDPVTLKTEEIMVNANFECDLNGGTAKVDVSEELRAKHNQALEIKRKIYEETERKAREARALAEAERQKNAPVKGKTMKVSCSRGKNKIHDGKVGKVFWIRDGRVGLNVTGEKDAKGYAKDPLWLNENNLIAV